MKLKLILIGLVLLFVAFALTGNAHAVTLSGDFSGTAYQQETIVESYNLCNTDEVSKVLTLKAIGSNSSWISIGQESSAYSAGECRTVFAFITPHPYADAGNYEIQMVVNNEATFSRFFELTVLQGHTVSLTLNNSSQTASQCEAKNYIFNVRNTGRFNETINLSTEGIPTTWKNFSLKDFSLSKGANKNITLTVQAPCNQKLDVYEFKIKAQIENTNFSISRDAEFEIENGQPISIISTAINACIDLETIADISFKNTGTFNDDIRIELLNAPNWIKLSQNTLAINAGQTKKIQIISSKTNAETKTYNPTIKVTSTKYGTNYQKELNILLNDCYNLLIEKVSGKEETCVEDNLSWEFELTNTGKQSANFVLKTSGLNATLDKTSIVLSPGQKQKITAVFDLSKETVAQKAFTLTADSENFSLQKSFQVNLLNCFDAKIIAPELSLCKGVQETGKIEIQNTGTLNQTYNLGISPAWIEPKESSIALNAGEKKSIDLLIKTPERNVEESYKITLSTDKIKQEIEKQISLKTNNECFGLSITTENINIDVNLSEGKKITIKITNNGVALQKIQVFASQEPWVFFNPKEIEIDSKAAKEVYVYLSPPIDFDLLKKTISISAKSDKGLEANLSLNLNFSGAKKVLSIAQNTIRVLEVKERKAVVEFMVSNDSASNLSISKISSTEEEANFNFEKRVIPSGTTQTIQATISLDDDSKELIVPLNFETSQGNYSKILMVQLPEDTVEGPTGFAFFANPFWAGIFILAIVAVLIIGYVVNRKFFAEAAINKETVVYEPQTDAKPSRKLGSKLSALKSAVTRKVSKRIKRKPKTVARNEKNIPKRSFKKFKKPITPAKKPTKSLLPVRVSKSLAVSKKAYPITRTNGKTETSAKAFRSFRNFRKKTTTVEEFREVKAAAAKRSRK
ncbi:MAG: hypothetical protein Q7S21_03870 [archaeon]|nr:hypothetical protein [archaeon]